MHANTQLPVLAGAHSRYEATGDGRFRALSSFFVGLLLRTRTFATGGSSTGEYWGKPNQLGEMVGPGEGTTQESCSTHNLMRLARGLLLTAALEEEALRHADFHERCRPSRSNPCPPERAVPGGGRRGRDEARRGGRDGVR